MLRSTVNIAAAKHTHLQTSIYSSTLPNELLFTTCYQLTVSVQTRTSKVGQTLSYFTMKGLSCFLCQSIKASLVLSGRELCLRLGKRPENCLPLSSDGEGRLLSRGVVRYSSNANLQDSLA